jgi:hypothetical protein
VSQAFGVRPGVLRPSPLIFAGDVGGGGEDTENLRIISCTRPGTPRTSEVAPSGDSPWTSVWSRTALGWDTISRRSSWEVASLVSLPLGKFAVAAVPDDENTVVVCLIKSNLSQ